MNFNNKGFLLPTMLIFIFFFISVLASYVAEQYNYYTVVKGYEKLSLYEEQMSKAVKNFKKDNILKELAFKDVKNSYQIKQYNIPFSNLLLLKQNMEISSKEMVALKLLVKGLAVAEKIPEVEEIPLPMYKVAFIDIKVKDKQYKQVAIFESEMTNGKKLYHTP